MGCLKRLKMRYVAAALPAALGGGDISAANINKILSSVGIESDAAKVDLVVKELAGKDVAEVIAEGTSKLGSMPSGGGAAAPAAGGAAPQLPKLLLPRKRPRKRVRKKTMTWASDSSTKGHLESAGPWRDSVT